MASEFPPPPAKASDLSQAPAEPSKEVSPKSVFVDSTPIREDQVQNAIKFLSHPRVQGSPVVHRRNFLERKGLTKEEIDEAFRRVPDPSPGVNGAQTTTSSQDGQMTPLPSTQQQISAHPITASSAASSVFLRRFGYFEAFLAIGFLAASGVGAVIFLKKSVVPRLRSWIRRVASDENNDLKRHTPSLNEEATASAKVAAAAAADATKASQELLIMKSEEKKRRDQFMSLMDAQLQELKSINTSIGKIKGQNYNSGRSSHVEEEYLNGTIARSKRPIDNGGSDFDSRSARSTSPPVTSEPPHPKSYMEIMAMIQRGEKPPNIRDINDAPPNPYQPISHSSLAPRPKPWETAKPASTSATNFGSQPSVTGNGTTSTVQDLGVAYQFSSESSASWQRKSASITEVADEGEHLRAGSNGEAVAPIEPPPQHKWVPSQSPPTTEPEAAEATHQPKSTVLKDRSLDSTSSNGTEFDELQRVTRISESGGEPDMNGSIAETASSFAEIQEEQEMS